MWAIVTQKFDTVVQSCELENWKEALAVVLTYAAGNDFNNLCGQAEFCACMLSYCRSFSSLLGVINN